MDFDRLRCLGRAAEYLGPSAITEDTLMRRRDFETVSRVDYDLCSADAKTALDAYAEGVNAFINSDDPLPYEYALLGTSPEAWEPWHCIVVYKVRNSAEGGFQSKLWRAKLAAKIGPEKAAKLSPGYQQGMFLTVPPGVIYDGPAENAVDELRATVNATAPLRERSMAAPTAGQSPATSPLPAYPWSAVTRTAAWKSRTSTTKSTCEPTSSTSWGTPYPECRWSCTSRTTAMSRGV